MKKLLKLIFLFIIYFITPANADTEWEGSCYIEYDGKVVVNNEICSIRQNGFSIDPTSYKHINEANNFQIVAVRDVPCDDGSKDCAYYFYADKFTVTGKTLYQINYNIEKERSKYPANLGEDFMINEYKPNDTESGLCFIKDRDKFCFAYIYKETKEFIQTPKKIEQTPKDKRTVTESKLDVAWKIDDKFIIPECFDYVWASPSKYIIFFDRYIEELEFHRLDPRFKNFISEIGTYLNKEVPLNHSVKTGWGEAPFTISLSRQLDNCMSDNPETEVLIDGDWAKSKFTYKVVETYNLEKGKELAPHINQEFESIKKVDVAAWGGGMLPSNHQVIYGLLTIDGKKVLLPLKNYVNHFRIFN